MQNEIQSFLNEIEMLIKVAFNLIKKIQSGTNLPKKVPKTIRSTTYPRKEKMLRIHSDLLPYFGDLSPKGKTF